MTAARRTGRYEHNRREVSRQISEERALDAGRRESGTGLRHFDLTSATLSSPVIRIRR